MIEKGANRPFLSNPTDMVIKKLLKENIGDHHPEEALIFSSNGDILLTQKEAQVEGFPLLKIFSKEEVENLIKTQVEAEIAQVTLTQKCGRNYNAGGYESNC